MRNEIVNMSEDEPVFVEHFREKLINSIIYFLKNTNYCFKTKLFKLLYILDFYHFKQTGRSVTGLDYFAWEKGPVPRELFEEFARPKQDLLQCVYIPRTKDPDGIFRMKPKCNFDTYFFSKRELRLLEQISYIFKDAKAEEMIEVTHLPNMPWDKTIRTKGEYEKIDYLLALDNTKESLSLDEVSKRINDAREFENIFKK